MSNRHIVILAGGQGSRLAPLSTPERPKQFLNLIDENKSLVEMTRDRCVPIVGDNNVWVSTLRRYLGYLADSNIIVEPAPRNTLPAILLSLAYIAAEHGESASVAFVPSDHYIEPVDKFVSNLTSAFNITTGLHSRVMLLGAQPSYPATQYGYIQPGTCFGHRVYGVKHFCEKPDQETAELYVAAGALWNLGILVFRISEFLHEIWKLDQGLYNIVTSLIISIRTDNRDQISRSFNQLPQISIDYGLIEHMKNLLVYQASFKWSDIGSHEELNKIKSDSGGK